MQDRELEFVKMLADDCRLAGRLYLAFASALLLSGISGFGWLVAHQAFDKVFLGGTSAILSLFSGIPAHLFFAARGQAIFFGSLQASWQDARAENDLAGLQKLKDELVELRKGSLSKPFWSLK